MARTSFAFNLLLINICTAESYTNIRFHVLILWNCKLNPKQTLAYCNTQVCCDIGNLPWRFNEMNIIPHPADQFTVVAQALFVIFFTGIYKYIWLMHYVFPEVIFLQGNTKLCYNFNVNPKLFSCLHIQSNIYIYIWSIIHIFFYKRAMC